MTRFNVVFTNSVSPTIVEAEDEAEARKKAVGHYRKFQWNVDLHTPEEIIKSVEPVAE